MVETASRTAAKIHGQRSGTLSCIRLHPILLMAALLGLVLDVLAGGAAAAASDPPPGCLPQPGPAHAVAAVLDGATVRLDDGKEARLTGILPPYAPGGRSEPETWPPELAAREALERLVLGRNVMLAAAGARTDRYGRILAQMLVEEGGERIWVQGALLAQGQARVHAAAGQTPCLTALLEHERAARAVRRGLWSSAAYDVVSPYAFKRLWRLRASYQIVQGRVAAIEEKWNGLSLRLTDRTRLTFHVHVPLGAGRRQHVAELKRLLHRRIEARGWIEWRHGPMLTVADPGLIVAVPPTMRSPQVLAP